jgi:hypothetical protein
LTTKTEKRESVIEEVKNVAQTSNQEEFLFVKSWAKEQCKSGETCQVKDLTRSKSETTIWHGRYRINFWTNTKRSDSIVEDNTIVRSLFIIVMNHLDKRRIEIKQ